MALLSTKRHEIKYTISYLDYITMRNRLSKLLKRDDNNISNVYTVSSLYFDSINNRAYFEKINGDAMRNKFRIRYYNNEFTTIKLEKKSKNGQMTSKSSASLTRDEVILIYQNDYEFLSQKEESLYKEFYLQLTHHLIYPKVIVSYEREAFTHKVGNTRITFDKNVRTSNNQTDIFSEKIKYLPAIGKEEVIMEIKFNQYLPDFINDIIQFGHNMASSSSKYVYSRKYNCEF